MFPVPALIYTFSIYFLCRCRVAIILGGRVKCPFCFFGERPKKTKKKKLKRPASTTSFVDFNLYRNNSSDNILFRELIRTIAIRVVA